MGRNGSGARAVLRSCRLGVELDHLHRFLFERFEHFCWCDSEELSAEIDLVDALFSEAFVEVVFDSDGVGREEEGVNVEPEDDFSSNQFVSKPTPLISDAGRYVARPGARPMRVYTNLDYRLMFEDFFLKLRGVCAMAGGGMASAWVTASPSGREETIRCSS